MLHLSRVAQIIHAASWAAPLVRAGERIVQALTELWRHAAARRELQWLDERTLRDIGLSHRAAAEWTQSRREA